MDYKLLKNTFEPIIKDNLSNIEKSKEQLNAIQARNTFDKNVLAILKNIHKNIEVNESLKKLAREMIDQGDYFSDTTIHQSTKSQTLKKILSTNNFIENNKMFNLSTLQAYLENILQKQLYEINIKVEENQRALNNLSFSNTQKAEPKPPRQVKEKYVLVESEQEKCADQVETIVEILKFPGPFPKKKLVEFTMIYNKISGVGRNYVIKQIQEDVINSNQVLGNANLALTNTEEKNFALITRKEDEFTIFFVDYVLYTNPVEAQELDGFIKTNEDTYKIIEV